MNNEIKEMIEQMESIAITSKDKNGIKVDGYGLQQNELKMFLDYITNLQQKEQEHKKINGELREENSKLEIALQNLQEDYDKRIEENERLKNDVEDISCSHFSLFKSYEDYKSRCEKAIEYINKNKKVVSKYEAKDTRLPLGTFMWGVDNLLNILQNGSDSQ